MQREDYLLENCMEDEEFREFYSCIPDEKWYSFPNSEIPESPKNGVLRLLVIRDGVELINLVGKELAKAVDLMIRKAIMLYNKKKVICYFSSCSFIPCYVMFLGYKSFNGCTAEYNSRTSSSAGDNEYTSQQDILFLIPGKGYLNWCDRDLPICCVLEFLLRSFHGDVHPAEA